MAGIRLLLYLMPVTGSGLADHVVVGENVLTWTPYGCSVDVHQRAQRFCPD